MKVVFDPQIFEDMCGALEMIRYELKKLNENGIEEYRIGNGFLQWRHNEVIGKRNDGSPIREWGEWRILSLDSSEQSVIEE